MWSCWHAALRIHWLNIHNWWKHCHLRRLIGNAIDSEWWHDPVALLKMLTLHFIAQKQKRVALSALWKKHGCWITTTAWSWNWFTWSCQSAVGFALFYQPQYDLQTSPLVGYEALVRWPHQQRQYFTCAIYYTRWSKQVSSTQWANGFCAAPVLMRKSGQSISKLRWICHLLNLEKRYCINCHSYRSWNWHQPERLELEITESLLLHNTDKDYRAAQSHPRNGVTIAMDEFGTGYSSLSYISRFPLTKLKLIKALSATWSRWRRWQRSFLQLSALDAHLILHNHCWGVENEAQAKILRELGCKHSRLSLWHTATNIAQ